MLLGHLSFCTDFLWGCGCFNESTVVKLLDFAFPSAVPRHADFSLNVEEIVRTVELEKPKCIFLTSPNNPDGR